MTTGGAAGGFPSKLTIYKTIRASLEELLLEKEEHRLCLVKRTFIVNAIKRLTIKNSVSQRSKYK